MFCLHIRRLPFALRDLDSSAGAMEQPDVLQRPWIPDCPSLQSDALRGRTAVSLPPRLDRGLRQVAPGLTWIGPAVAEAPGKQANGSSAGIPTSSASMSRTRRKADDPGRIDRAGTHHDRAHRVIGAVLALVAVAYGVALQNLHTAGWTNPAVAAIGTLRRSERRSAIDRGEGIVYSSRRVPRLS